MEGRWIFFGLASLRPVCLQEAPEESTRCSIPKRTPLPAGKAQASKHHLPGLHQRDKMAILERRNRQPSPPIAMGGLSQLERT
jgi:hypothetical protein